MGIQQAVERQDRPIVTRYIVQMAEKIVSIELQSDSFCVDTQNLRSIHVTNKAYEHAYVRVY